MTTYDYSDIGGSLRKTTVKLLTVIRPSNYYEPWKPHPERHSGGSGCIIEGHKILTSAHVVTHQMHIQVMKQNDPKKYSARVNYVDHQRELAILTVDDLRFFENTIAVKLGSLPQHNSPVSIYGFPIGGNELSVTVGVVSRIEARTYIHSQRFMLALQTDAAINPGSSGGPAFSDGQLIGIAFQAYDSRDAQRTGYLVPSPIISAFIRDWQSGRTPDVPDLGIFWQKIENDALVKRYQLNEDQGGVIVSKVVYESSAFEHLYVDDIILSIDDISLARDGSCLVDGHRIHFSHLISCKQVGDTATLEVLRNGAPQRVHLELRPFVSLVPPPRPDRKPRYFIFAGLVLVPLTYDYMSSWGFEKAHFRFKYYYYDVLPSKHAREKIILSKILAHDINVGYHHMYGVVVEKINGIVITEMRDVVAALAHPVDGIHTIEIDNHGTRTESSDYYSSYGRIVAIDASRAPSATAEILKLHGIVSDRSEDLEPTQLSDHERHSST